MLEIPLQSEIKDSLETVNNPFESNESIFLSTDNRATQRRNRELRNRYKKGLTRHTSKRFRTAEDQDPEIQVEVDM